MKWRLWESFDSILESSSCSKEESVVFDEKRRFNNLCLYLIDKSRMGWIFKSNILDIY